ncbi:acyl-CoA Delta(11) desaturase-like isoform X2 [Linepithema humile]|uniref:acyl-CoA Delta(11) desaturase-like isoform X2 n=1 Tax=Linepithema humile TaxID=83485 RepID=UPI0006232520|nr:PREDICTED: acyl-CoA Delta(11) desaturase-like [Linepithema humile]
MYSSTITEYEDNKDKKSLETKNEKESIFDQPPKEHIPAVQPLIWRNIIGLAILHVLAIYLFITRIFKVSIWTWVFGFTYGFFVIIGISAGAHRLWAHKSYSAKLPLRILLAIFYCMAGQTHLTKWVRVHRTHHRYTDTSADPHNSNRGFFFSHVGWLMMKHHPAVKEYGKNVDMSDLAADPVIRFFDKYYPPIMLSVCFVLPTLIQVYLWNETWDIAINSVIVRYVISLNATFSVNSFAHLWGTRPYDRNLKARENIGVAIVANGEGWHNYHHAFPWDYRNAELGFHSLNLAAGFIELMAWLGLAYNLKTPSPEIIEKYCANKGDGTIGFSRRKARQISSKHTTAVE